MVHLTSDTIDIHSGTTVQEVIDALAEYGVDLAEATFGIYDEWASVEFKRPETEAERTKRLEREKRTREYAAARKEKEEAAEYKLYLELEKKYNRPA